MGSWPQASKLLQLKARLQANGVAVDYHYYPTATHLLTVNTAHRQLFADV